MEIYFYLKHFSPRGNNLHEGTRKAVHGLASGLAKCGADVTVLCENSTDSSFQTPDGYSIKCFANRIQSAPSFTISPNLKNYIRDHLNNKRLVVLNGIFHPSVYSMSRLLKKHSVPYIAAPHDPYHPTIFGKNAHLKWPYWYLFERRMLNQAKAVQVLDIRHAEWLNRLGVKTSILETPNGFSPTDVQPESALHWRKEGAPKLVFLGRMDAHNKALDILIDAFAQVTKMTSAQLSIQGPDWGDRKALEERVTKLPISVNVSFLNPDYDKSPSALIADYDIFCLPSRFEGFGLSALEAMLAGRVLLVSEVAGIAPHVQASGCGVVVKPEVSAVQAGLMKLLQCRSEWKEMGLKGRNYVLNNLHWKRIAATTLKRYEALHV